MFQEQLITGDRNDEKQTGVDASINDLGLMESTLDAMVDLQQSAIFEEPFYIVVLERTQQGTTVHMWRLVIASQPETTGTPPLKIIIGVLHVSCRIALSLVMSS